ncbi:nitroreductase family protein [bacterium]|nr:nitroreductase family protein [bacterium]
MEFLFNVDLYNALSKRMTTRKYGNVELSEKNLLKILWAGVGKNRESNGRTAPMPLGDVIINLYVASRDGVMLYNGEKNSLKSVSKEDIRAKIAHQDFVGDAANVIIMTADIESYPDSINKESRNIWTHATAGAVAQNIYLAAASLNLGTAMIAWIKHDEIEKLLPLKKVEKPFYIMPVGK